MLYSKNRENISNVLEGLDNIDEMINIDYYPTVVKNKYLEYEAQTGAVLVMTALARTATSSTNKIYDEVENVSFKGISYRKDICKSMSAIV